MPWYQWFRRRISKSVGCHFQCIMMLFSDLKVRAHANHALVGIYLGRYPMGIIIQMTVRSHSQTTKYSVSPRHLSIIINDISGRKKNTIFLPSRHAAASDIHGGYRRRAPNFQEEYKEREEHCYPQ